MVVEMSVVEEWFEKVRIQGESRDGPLLPPAETIL